MIDVGLVDETWLTRLPAAARRATEGAAGQPRRMMSVLRLVRAAQWSNRRVRRPPTKLSKTRLPISSVEQ